MRIFIILITLLLIDNVAISQNNDFLKNQMWSYINECYTVIKDGQEDGMPYPDVIEDYANGYLMVSGNWPTCGCGCTSVVGAYKKADNSYVFLKTDEWVCNYKYSIISNVDIYRIMPIGFGLDTFLDSTDIDNSDEYSTFYLKADIPRYGTKTKFTLALIPIGLKVECPDNMCFSIKEFHSNETYYENANMLFYLKDFVSKISDVNALMSIMYKEKNTLNESNKKAINNEHYIQGANFEEKLETISKDLLYVYFRYKMYKQQKYTSVILVWDANESKFKIIKKEKAPIKMDFIKFIIESDFWQPRC
jgi:hypothetical protein